MAWQEPRYIYTKPDSDPVNSAVTGVMDGLKMYMGISAVQGASRKNALDSDVSKAYKDMESSMPTAPAQPNQAAQGFQAPKSYTPEQLTAMQGAQGQQGKALNPLSEAGQGFGTAPQVANSPAPAMNVAQADEAAQAKYQQEMTDYQNKVIEKRAEFSGKLIDLHRKHGFVKEAADLENNYIKQVGAVAAMDPGMAEKVWNRGPMKKQYGEISVKSTTEWEKLSDGSGVYNKAHPEQVIKWPQDHQPFMVEGETFIPDNKGGIIHVQKKDKTKITTLPDNVPGYVKTTPDGEDNYVRNPGYLPENSKASREDAREAQRIAREERKDAKDAIKTALTSNQEYWREFRKTATDYIKTYKGSLKLDEAQRALNYESILEKLPDYERKDRKEISEGREAQNPMIAENFIFGAKKQASATDYAAKKDNKNRKPLSSFGR